MFVRLSVYDWRIQRRPHCLWAGLLAHKFLQNQYQTTNTYVVGLQIWVVFFESVVQNGDHNSLARVAHLPGGLNVEIEPISSAAVL